MPTSGAPSRGTGDAVFSEQRDRRAPPTHLDDLRSIQGPHKPTTAAPPAGLDSGPLGECRAAQRHALPGGAVGTRAVPDRSIDANSDANLAAPAKGPGAVSEECVNISVAPSLHVGDGGVAEGYGTLTVPVGLAAVGSVLHESGRAPAASLTEHPRRHTHTHTQQQTHVNCASLPARSPKSPALQYGRPANCPRRPVMSAHHVETAMVPGMTFPNGYEATSLTPMWEARYPYGNLQSRLRGPGSCGSLAGSLSPGVAALGAATTVAHTTSPQGSLNLSLTMPAANQSLSLRDGAALIGASFANTNTAGREASFARDSSFPSQSPSGASPVMFAAGALSPASSVRGPLSRTTGGPTDSAVRRLRAPPAQLPLSPPVDRLAPALMVGDCILESSPRPLPALARDEDATVSLGDPTSADYMAAAPLTGEEELLEAEQLCSSQSNLTYSSASQLNSAFYQPLRPPFRTEGAVPPPSLPGPRTPDTAEAVPHVGGRPSTPVSPPAAATTTGTAAAVGHSPEPTRHKTIATHWMGSHTTTTTTTGVGGWAGLVYSGSEDGGAWVGAGTVSDECRSGDDIPRALDRTARPGHGFTASASQEIAAALRSAEASARDVPPLTAAIAAAEPVEDPRAEHPPPMDSRAQDTRKGAGAAVLTTAAEEEDPDIAATRTSRGGEVVPHPSSPLTRGRAAPARRRPPETADTDATGPPGRHPTAGESPVSLSVDSELGLAGSLPLSARHPNASRRVMSSGRPFEEPLTTAETFLQSAGGTVISCGPLTPTFAHNRMPVLRNLGDRSLTPGTTPTMQGGLQPSRTSTGSVVDLVTAGGGGVGGGGGGGNNHHHGIIGASANALPTSTGAGAGFTGTVTVPPGSTPVSGARHRTGPPAPAPSAVLWRVACPLEEMSDLVEVVRLFASDVGNVLQPVIPSYHYPLQSAATRALVQLFALLDALAETILGTRDGHRSYTGFLQSAWQPVLERCLALVTSTLPAAAQEASDIARRARTGTRRKQVIAAWTVEALREAVALLEEAGGKRGGTRAEAPLTLPRTTPSPMPIAHGLESTPISVPATATTEHVAGSSEEGGDSRCGRRPLPTHTRSCVAEDERKAVAARAPDMTLDELCEWLSGERTLRDALNRQHPAAVARAQAAQVRVALLRALLLVCGRNPSGYQRRHTRPPPPALHVRTASGVGNTSTPRSDDDDDESASSLTPPAAPLRDARTEAEREHMLVGCVGALLQHMANVHRHRQGGGPAAGEPADPQVGELSARPLPSFEETTAHFADMASPAAWTWWYGWKLATHLAAERCASSMRRVQLHASSFLQTHDGGRALLAALRGDASSWCEDALRAAEHALAVEEAAYVSVTRQCLQRMLRRMVLRACGRESRAMLEAYSYRAAAVTGGAAAPTPVEALSSCLTAHYASVRLAHDELTMFADGVEEDVARLRGYAEKWHRLAGAEAAGPHAPRSASSMPVHRLAAIRDGCTNPQCTYCRGEGLYAMLEDRLDVVDAALASVDTAAGLLLRIMQRGTYHAGGGGAEKQRTWDPAVAPGAMAERSPGGHCTTTATRTRSPSDASRERGGPERTTAQAVPIISLQLRQTTSGRTNAFEEDAVECGGSPVGVENSSSSSSSHDRPSDAGGAYDTVQRQPPALTALRPSTAVDSSDSSNPRTARAGLTTPGAASSPAPPHGETREALSTGQALGERDRGNWGPRGGAKGSVSKRPFTQRSSVRALNRLQRSLEDLSVSVERNLLSLL